MSSLILPPGYVTMGYSRPEPSPELEAKVRPWLQEMDSLLDVRWFENIVPNARHNTFEGRYALVCRWPLMDKRYGMIQNGELGNDPYDILGWYTEDMQDASSAAVTIDSFETKTLELLASADNTRVEWKERLKRSAEKNVERKRKLKVDFLENTIHGMAEFYRNEGLKIQQESGFDMTNKESK